MNNSPAVSDFILLFIFLFLDFIHSYKRKVPPQQSVEIRFGTLLSKFTAGEESLDLKENALSRTPVKIFMLILAGAFSSEQTFRLVKHKCSFKNLNVYLSFISLESTRFTLGLPESA